MINRNEGKNIIQDKGFLMILFLMIPFLINDLILNNKVDNIEFIPFKA